MRVFYVMVIRFSNRSKLRKIIELRSSIVVDWMVFVIVVVMVVAI